MATELPTAVDTRLLQRVVHDFYALKVTLPSATIRLLDGSGTVTFDPGTGSETFTGRDATFGVLESADAFRDGFGDEAPSLHFSIQPASDSAIASLTSPDNQLSPVKVYYGTRDPATGAVDGVALRFDGFLDFATIEGDADAKVSIEFQCITWAELYFRNLEGVGLSDAFHQSLYPGETGLAYVTGVQRTIVWGPGDRPNNLAAGYPNIYTGFGGGGGGYGIGGIRRY